MSRSMFVAVGCLVVMTSAASGQDPLLIPGDRNASAEVSKIVETASAAGLPTTPIVSKVQYGVMRRARPSGIVQAARQIAKRLEDARTALAPNPTHPDVVAGADALGLEATPDALREIRRVGGQRSLVLPLSVLTQLLSSGVKVERATAVVTAMMKNGVTEPQIVAFGNDVNADVGAGLKPDASVDARVQGLAAVLGAAGSNFSGDAALSAPSTVGQNLGSTKSNPTPVRPRP